jgi:predicted nucleic acid-binding protein
MKRVYLDSNILIAHYSIDRAEEAKKELVETALDAYDQLKDVQLCTSVWAITEMVNILVSNKKMGRGDVAEIESQLVSERRLNNLKIHIVEVSPQKSYDFIEFFYHVRQGILKYHSGVGDIIHSVIMKNNGITEILTFDEKNDFKQIPGLVVLHLSCLNWKWRKRSSVKITERTHEKATEALHAGRKSSHFEAAFGGRSADLGSV